MSITEQDIRNVAQLARIALPEEGVAPLVTELDRVLHLVEQMNSADTTDVAPMAHPDEAALRLRDDEVSEIDERKQLQGPAPLVEQGYFIVPRVIE